VPGYSFGASGRWLRVSSDDDLDSGGEYDCHDDAAAVHWIDQQVQLRRPARFDRRLASCGSAVADCRQWYEHRDVMALWTVMWFDDLDQYHEDCYRDFDGSLSPDDFLILAEDERSRRQNLIDRARARTQTMASPHSRQAIPDDVKIFVWKRDGGRCVRCGTNADLEFDHIIPVVMGGSSTARNLQLLCAACNRAKGGHLV
jgi:5-methylcytosine-specific restriction endonuclease McrA